MADLCSECGKFVPRACRDIVAAFTCPFDLFATVRPDRSGDRLPCGSETPANPQGTAAAPAPPQFRTAPD